jgi:hypothetical protein
MPKSVGVLSDNFFKKYKPRNIWCLFF